MPTKTGPKRTRSEKSDDFPLTLKRGSSVVKIYRHQDNGYEVYTLVYYLHGERKRPTFASLEAARDEADRVLDQINNGEPDVLTLTNTERLAYLRAKQVLEKLNVPVDVAAIQFAHATDQLNGHGTLADAVAYYVKTRPQMLKSATVQEAVDLLLAARKADCSSPRHVDDLKSRLNRFATAFHCPISSVTAGDIHDFLVSLKLEPRTCNNYRMAISNLFAFARLKRFVPKDYEPLKEVPEFKEPIKPVPIFTPKELARLLEKVSLDFLPYLVIGAFAGLRQSEIERLDWTHVGAKYIKVPPASHRVKSTRFVPIQSNLEPWLVVPFKNVTNQIRRLCDKAEITAQHNVLRHSFGSYRLALLEDFAKVSFEMGNSPKMVERHYREVVTPEEAQAWFGILPPKGGLDLKPSKGLAQALRAAANAQK
jgi:integrase